VRPSELTGKPAALRQIVTAYALAAAVVVLDLATKRWAALEFASGPRTVIPGILGFRYVENPGAAFSLFQNAGPFLGVAAVVAVGAVGAAVARRPRPGHEIVAFGFIIGGALGNLVDRIARGRGFLDGHVIDWVQLLAIPTFNIADSAITVSVAILLVASWFSKPVDRQTVDEQKA
jgi:signal peptidase II